VIELRNAARRLPPSGNQRRSPAAFTEPTESAAKYSFVIVKGGAKRSNARAKVGLVRITKSIGYASLLGSVRRVVGTMDAARLGR